MIGKSNIFKIDLRNYSIENLENWMTQFANTELKFPALILLEGPMGAGKTTFTRLFAKYLGCNTNFVNSPTFALHQRYPILKDFSNVHVKESNYKIDHIDHFDLYRLESEEDLETSGFWEILNEPSQLLIVEWPSQISIENWIPNIYSIYEIQLGRT